MTEGKQYWHPDYSSSVTPEQLHEADSDIQRDVMSIWFLSNFEHPAEHTPYESREGGYIYIWGGPYDAEEELCSEFADIVPEQVIDGLVKELEAESTEWAGKPSADDFDDYYYAAVSSNTGFHEAFLNSIEVIKSLLDIRPEGDLEQHFLRLLHVNAITALETFLSDAFINTVLKDRSLIRKFVETNPDFKKQKFSLNEVFERFDQIDNEVKRYLLEIMWHNIEKVRPMYRDTLGINFPSDIGNIFRAIAVRHDIVHRNGKTKEGEATPLSREDLQRLLNEIRAFADHIDSHFKSDEPFVDLGF